MRDRGRVRTLPRDNGGSYDRSVRRRTLSFHSIDTRGAPVSRLPARAAISLALALLHAVVAFEVAYQWSHGAASMDTARKTAAVTGIGVAG